MEQEPQRVTMLGLNEEKYAGPERPATKQCAHCSEWKPLGEFKRRSGRRSGRTGRRGACSACRLREQREESQATTAAAARGRADAGKGERRHGAAVPAKGAAKADKAAVPPHGVVGGDTGRTEASPHGVTAATANEAGPGSASAPTDAEMAKAAGPTGTLAARGVTADPAAAGTLAEPRVAGEAESAARVVAGRGETAGAMAESALGEAAPRKRRRRRRKRGGAKAMANAQALAGEAPAPGTAGAPPRRIRRPLPMPPPRPEGPDASMLRPTRSGIIKMRGKTDKGRRWVQETDLETAVNLVREHAAVVVNPHTIRRLYTNKAFRTYVLTRDLYTCYFCGEYGETIDHLVPRAKGGHTTPINCVCACHLCNQSKADRNLDEFCPDDEAEA